MQAASNFAQNQMGLVDVPVEASYKADPSGKKMKALAWFGTKDVRMIEAPVPDITQEEDVILQITGTTICGSDLHLYHGEIMALQKGDILGHEFMGKVVKVGKNVKKVKVGQRVVSAFQIPCGECEYCKQNLSSFCDNSNNSSLQNYMYGQRDAGFFGYSHFTGGFPGGQAEYVRVPREAGLLVIPDDVPDEKALYLSDILPTSYHSVVDTGVNEGDTVGIWGLGPIGLCAAKWAFIKGAKRVIGIDKVKDRLNFAKKHIEGIEVFDFTEDTDVPKKIYEMVPRGLDVALDCGTFHEPKTMIHKVQKTLMLETDVSETANEMIVSVRKMGRCGTIAAYAGLANGVNLGALMEKGVRFIGNGQAPVLKYWEEILNDYIIPGKFDPTFVLTHRVPIDDMAKLYDAFDRRIAGVEKVFVETSASAPAAPGTPALTRVDDWEA